MYEAYLTYIVSIQNGNVFKLKQLLFFDIDPDKRCAVQSQPVSTTIIK